MAKKTKSRRAAAAKVPPAVKNSTLKMLTATRALLDEPNSVRAVFDDAYQRLKGGGAAKTKEETFVLNATLKLMAASRPMLDQAPALRELIDDAIEQVRKGPGTARLQEIPVR